MSEITIEGRVFVDVAPSRAAKGAYVEYRGRIYPAAKGYPVRVLAEVAADPGQLVVFGHSEGVVATLAGTHRVIFIKQDPENPDALHSSLLRLLLASSSSTPVSFGDVGIPGEQKTLRDVKLPDVIYPRKVIGGIATAILFLALCAAGGYVALQQSKNALEAAAVASQQAKTEAERLQAKVSTLKGQVGDRDRRPVNEEVPDAGEMPEPNQSFAEAIMAFPPNTLLRIVNGQIQTSTGG